MQWESDSDFSNEWELDFGKQLDFWKQLELDFLNDFLWESDFLNDLLWESDFSNDLLWELDFLNDFPSESDFLILSEVVCSCKAIWKETYLCTLKLHKFACSKKSTVRMNHLPQTWTKKVTHISILRRCPLVLMLDNLVINLH
jgi:hypothetical protein